MKKQLLLSILSFSFVMPVMAQCVPAVPSNAIVVSSTTTINGGFDPIWVCSNAILQSDGGFHNIFLEPGAAMTSGGGIDTIYVKDGASFFMNGGIHVIFYVNASDIDIAGGIPTLIACSSLTFDYTNAPANGCALALVAAFQSSDSSICPGSCINFSSLSATANSWQWTFAGATPMNSTDENPQNICYETPGDYLVSLIVTNSSGSDTLTINNFITVNAPPAVSPLSVSNDTLYSPAGYATYQWYYESTLIPGATNYYYVAEESGDYTIVVTDSNGCEASGFIKYLATGVDPATIAANNDPLLVFPNPATDRIDIIDFNNQLLRFFDLHGRCFFSVRSSSSGKTEVDISSFPILFFIRDENGSLVKVIRY